MAGLPSQFVLPSLNAPDGGGTNVNFRNHQLPAFEDAFNLPPNFEGFGLTTVVLAYLTQIWIDHFAPTFGSTVSIPVSDSGFTDVTAYAETPRIVSAALELQLPPPPTTDMIFGDVPVYYLGMAGYAVQDNPEPMLNFGNVFFQLGANNNPPLQYPPQFVNSGRNLFTNTDRNVNAFWWHLKPGVRGILSLQLADLSLGVTCNYGEQNLYQHYNPLAGGFYTIDGLQGQFDGGLNPVSPNS